MIVEEMNAASTAVVAQDASVRSKGMDRLPVMRNGEGRVGMAHLLQLEALKDSLRYWVNLN